MPIKLEFAGKGKPSVTSSGRKYGVNGWDRAKIKEENRNMRSRSKALRSKKQDPFKGEDKESFSKKEENLKGKNTNDN